MVNFMLPIIVIVIFLIENRTIEIINIQVPVAIYRL